MNKYTQNLQSELNNCGKIPEIEIEVINTKGEQDFVICEIFFKGNSIMAERDAVSEKEKRSIFIATDKLVVDSCFSLDEHLYALLDLVHESINAGEIFKLV